MVAMPRGSGRSVFVGSVFVSRLEVPDPPLRSLRTVATSNDRCFIILMITRRTLHVTSCLESYLLNSHDWKPEYMSGEHNECKCIHKGTRCQCGVWCESYRGFLAFSIFCMKKNKNSWKEKKKIFDTCLRWMDGGMRLNVTQGAKWWRRVTICVGQDLHYYSKKPSEYINAVHWKEDLHFNYFIRIQQWCNVRHCVFHTGLRQNSSLIILSRPLLL